MGTRRNSSNSNMSLNGKYQLDTSENYDVWLTAVGVPEDKMKMMCAAKPKMEISVNGDQLTANITIGEESFTSSITSGQESKAALPGGLEFQVNLTIAGSVAKGTFVFLGKSGDATLTFTDEGFTQVATVEGVTMKRIYKRQ